MFILYMLPLLERDPTQKRHAICCMFLISLKYCYWIIKSIDVVFPLHKRTEMFKDKTIPHVEKTSLIRCKFSCVFFLVCILFSLLFKFLWRNKENIVYSDLICCSPILPWPCPPPPPPVHRHPALASSPSSLLRSRNVTLQLVRLLTSRRRTVLFTILFYYSCMSKSGYIIEFSLNKDIFSRLCRFYRITRKTKKIQ